MSSFLSHLIFNKILPTFLIGVPDCAREAIWSFNEFKLSLDCPFAIDLSRNYEIKLHLVVAFKVRC